MVSQVQVLATTAADKVLRKKLAKLYPYDVWYFIAAFIFLILGVIRVVSETYSYLHRRGHFTNDPEALASSRSTGAISLRRLHLAIANAYRIVAFRSIVPIGGGHSLNVAELVLTGTYIIIMFTWTLINCTSSYLATVVLPSDTYTYLQRMI